MLFIITLVASKQKIQANLSYIFSSPGRDVVVKIIQNPLEVSHLHAKDCWLSHIPQIKSVLQAPKMCEKCLAIGHINDMTN